jgi:hypothetical protein
MACKVKDGKFVIPCKGLASVAEPMYGRKPRRGVVQWTLYKIGDSDFSKSRTFFGVASGAHAAKGICFNYCPFCGKDISAPFQAEKVNVKDRPSSKIRRGAKGTAQRETARDAQAA